MKPRRTGLRSYLLRLLDQPVMNRVQRQFQPVRNAKLVENIVQVVLHRLLADKKLLADFLVAKPLRHQLHDFFFAVAQQRLLAPRPGIRRLRERLHHFRGHVVIEPDFARVYAVNTFHQQIGGGLLQHHSPSAQPHRSHHVAIVFRGGQQITRVGS